MPKDVGSSRSTPLVVDASGLAGSPGSPGRVGDMGCDGGDAGQPQPGAPGGVVDLYVSADALQRVHVVGQQAANNDRAEQIDVTLQPGTALDVRAGGGAGGAGGAGGKGGTGVCGARGKDGLAGAAPTPGQCGGAGGAGGAGSHGASGGMGGAVRVRVPLQDLDLLAAVRPCVRGGPGGGAGVHGEGGSGGPGGAGGDSGAANRGFFATEAPPRRRGAMGPAGQRPTQPLAAGALGPNGSVEYWVDGLTTEPFAERFAFQLGHPRLVNARGVGSTRPFFGDTVGCMVSVTNTSAMPSPQDNPLHVEIVPGEWVQPQQAYRLPPGLSHNRTAPTPAMQFKIPYPNEVASGERLVKQVDLALQVVNPRIGVPLEESLIHVPVEVTHPVELGVIEGEHVAEGDKPAQVHWQVRNLSDRTLGMDSHEGRGVRCVVRADGEVPADKVLFRASGGGAPQGLPLQQALNQVVRRLNPGQAVDLRGEVFFARDVPLYANTRLVVELHVDDADSHADRLIQQREFAIQRATEQLRDGRAELLLVVNSDTCPDEVQAWQELAAELGTSLNIWNLALHGDVALRRAVEGHVLANEYAGKTVVWLNNAFNTPNGQDSATTYVDAAEYVAASLASGVSNYVVGPAGGFSLKDAVDAQPEGRRAQVHHSLHTFQDADVANKVGTAQENGRDVIQVRSRKKPREDRLRAEQAELAQWLQQRHPDRAYKLSAFFDPGTTADRSESKKAYHVGCIRLSRRLDMTARAVVQHDLQPRDMHAPHRIKSAENRYGLCKALPFEAKLRALDRMVQEVDVSETPMFTALFEALMSDIVEEQRVLRADREGGLLSRAELADRMNHLRTFSQFFAQPATLSSFRWNTLLKLVGSIDGLMRANMTRADTQPSYWPSRAKDLWAVWREMSACMAKRAFAQGSPEAIAQERRVAADLMVDAVEAVGPVGLRFPDDVVVGVTADHEVRGAPVEVVDVTTELGAWYLDEAQASFSADSTSDAA